MLNIKRRIKSHQRIVKTVHSAYLQTVDWVDRDLVALSAKVKRLVSVRQLKYYTFRNIVTHVKVDSWGSTVSSYIHSTKNSRETK